MAGNNILTNKIKVHRAIKNVTQQELAEALAVTRKTVNTIENGIYVPSTVLALKMARFFEVPVEELFALTGENDKL